MIDNTNSEDYKELRSKGQALFPKQVVANQLENMIMKQPISGRRLLSIRESNIQINNN
jgi:hypothetical protein